MTIERNNMPTGDGSSEINPGDIHIEPNVGEALESVPKRGSGVQILVKPGEQIPPESYISPSVEAVRRAGYIEQTVSQARWQLEPVEIRGQLAPTVTPVELGAPVPGETKRLWWKGTGDEWEGLGHVPKERLVLGAAIAINDYDNRLRYTDRAEMSLYDQALADFMEFAEGTRIYKRNAAMFESIRFFDEAEERALATITNQNSRDTAKLRVYRLDRLLIQQIDLEKNGVRAGAERNPAYTETEWEDVLLRKEGVDQEIVRLRGEVTTQLGAGFLTNREELKEKIKAREIELEQKDDQEAELQKQEAPEYQSDEEKVLEKGDLPVNFADKSFLDAEAIINRHNKTDKELTVASEVRPTATEVQEAQKAINWFVEDAEERGVFEDLMSPLTRSAGDWAKNVAENPSNIFEVNISGLINRAQTTQDTLQLWVQLARSLGRDGRLLDSAGNPIDFNRYYGVRSVFIERFYNNLQIVLKNLTVSEDLKVPVADFESTPGVDWQELQHKLTDGKKWFERQLGTYIVFKGETARTIKIGAEQFAYEVLHGTNSYDIQKIQTNMESFVTALGGIDIERLMENEGWSKSQATQFLETLRHSIENQVSFHILDYFGNTIEMESFNNYFKNYWAKEGTDRMRDLLLENDGMEVWVMHLLQTKYRLLFTSDGFQGKLTNDKQIQYVLREQIKEALIRDAMEWELRGLYLDDGQQARLLVLRAKNEIDRTPKEKIELKDLTTLEQDIQKLLELRGKNKDQLTPIERQELRRLETKEASAKKKSKEDIVKCKKEDEIKTRFQLRREKLSDRLTKARKDYREKAARAAELRLKKQNGAVLSPEELDAVDNLPNELKSKRRVLNQAKREYDEAHLKAKSAVDLALKVFNCMGISAEIGPVRIIAENGDNINITEFVQALKFAVLEGGRQAFKNEYGFEDNLALMRVRAMDWNNNYAESQAVFHLWQMYDQRAHHHQTRLAALKGKRSLTLTEQVELTNLQHPDHMVEFYESVQAGYDRRVEALKEGRHREKYGGFKGKTPFQRISEMTKPQAKQSVVTILVQTDQGVSGEVDFKLAPGYERTGITVQQFQAVEQALTSIYRDGYNAVIGGVSFKEIMTRKDLKPVLNNFLAQYGGTRDGQNSPQAIRAGLRGEQPWLEVNRERLAKSGRMGFKGLEMVEADSEQERADIFGMAVAESISFDEGMWELAYAISTNLDSQGHVTTNRTNGSFNPKRFTYGVPGLSWGIKRNDYFPGFAVTNLGREVGRFPEIVRSTPMHPRPLPMELGMDTITEFIGNFPAFDPADNWSIMTYIMRKEAMQKFKGNYEGSFDQEMKMLFGASDKLLDDSDAARVLLHHLVGNNYTLDEVFGQLLIESSIIGDSREEQVIQGAMERWSRIVKLLGPIASYYQSSAGGEATGLGMEQNDKFHNSIILPTLLSEGKADGERREQSGLTVYKAIVEPLLLLTMPKAWANTESLMRHHYLKGRQARDAGLSKAGVFVRV